jgi:UDP-N-acetylmuramoyl-tripeptide--D-alanyl-D-alanine ligase
MRWTVQQVAGALGVSPPAGLDPLARLAGVSIDSRTLRPGELFFAIRGPSHDGHTFVAAVLATGASAAVVARDKSENYSAEIRGRLFVVEDPLAALQQLARSACRAWREERPGRRIAAITGSAGKTTTKEILAALLAARLRVLKSEGNLNNDYGLPLTLFRLEDEDVAVVELGMSRRGELARLAAICEPEVGIVTNVAPVHLEFFASVDEIALAKRELVEGLGGERPVAVLNADDARVSRFEEGFRGRVLRFGSAPDAQFRAEGIEDRGAEGSAFEFIAPAGRARLELPLAGRHNVQNAVAALAAASEWGIGAAAAQAVFPTLRPAAMRGEVLKFEDGFSVINDAYNSNPLALARMVDLLAATPGYRRRILAAGEMLELGPTSRALHREAGRHAAEKKIDWIIGVRGDAAELVAGATGAGHPAAQAQFFATSEEAATFLAGMIDRGDVLLVKGSRGVRMERVVEVLTQKFCVKKSPSTKESVETARQVRG